MSAESVARTMPQLERHLFCEQVESVEKIFTHKHRIQRTTSPWYVDLSRFVVEGLEILPERLLYLDSDTYVIDPVPELWDLLKRFDLAAAQAPGRQTAPTLEPISAAFPEFNIGVIIQRNNERVRRLWREVLTRITTHFDRYGNNDQAPLREAIWNDGDLRVAVLPPEYNCRFNFGTFVTGRVKILHGRGNYRAVADSLNSQIGMRTWQP